jgi:hypothetical protein
MSLASAINRRPAHEGIIAANLGGKIAISPDESASVEVDEWDRLFTTVGFIHGRGWPEDIRSRTASFTADVVCEAVALRIGRSTE